MAYVLAITGDELDSGIFGEIHVHDSIADQNIATGASYTKLTTFTDNGFSANCTPDQANNKITLTVPGRYRIEGAFSFSSGTANVEWFGGLFLDSVEQGNIHWTRKVSTAGDVGNANFTGIIEVYTVPIDIDVRVRHDNGGSIDIQVSYANLNCSYEGK